MRILAHPEKSHPSTLFKDETGKRYGRYVVLSRAPADGKQTKWLCRCDCGNERAVIGSALRNGGAQSCGCLRVERAVAARKRHGMTQHPAFQVYVAARQRCINRRNKGFANYGARGIEFRFASFEQFWQHIGDQWEPGLSLDRINNDGHYEVGNVQWATRAVQGRNQRSNIWIEHDGKRMVVSDWARATGISRSCLTNRYRRFGADPAKLFAPT